MLLCLCCLFRRAVFAVVSFFCYQCFVLVWDKFRIAYWVVVRLLFAFFLCVFVIFFAHFVHSHFALFVIAGFFAFDISPVGQVFAVSVRFFVVRSLAGLLASCCVSCSVLLSLSPFFCYFYFAFHSLWFWTLL